jgi:hypothetical protein
MVQQSRLNRRAICIHANRSFSFPILFLHRMPKAQSLRTGLLGYDKDYTLAGVAGVATGRGILLIVFMMDNTSLA